MEELNPERVAETQPAMRDEQEQTVCAAPQAETDTAQPVNETAAEPKAPAAAAEEAPAEQPETAAAAETERLAEAEAAVGLEEAAPAEREPEHPAEPEAPKRTEVVDIRFRNNTKIYFFDPNGLTLKTGDHVVIETARGDEFGLCTAGNHSVSAGEVVAPLRRVLRAATAQDEKVNQENQAKEKKAFEVCQKKIEDHKLEMQLVSAECAFDGSKILFFFTAEGRVDFRELVKDLASVFRTRIELRQIGVRDKAKMVGGLGVCGRPFCCKEFLDDFQPVSIKMAKTQNLSLNPTKISGTCGRLMCCLKYEQEAYEDLLKTAPKNESFVDTPDGRGTVTEVNLLRQSVKVRMEDSPETIGCYKNCDICVLRNGKARKNDPPIPKDLAPISSKPRKAQPKPDEFEPLPEVIYPDQVSVFSREEVFAAPIIPAEPAAQDAPAEDAAGAKQPQNRRRRRRGRGKGPEGAAQTEGKQPTEKSAEKAPSEKPNEPRREKRPNDNKPRPPRQNQERKPQGEKQPGQPQQSNAPVQESGDGAPKRPRRRRYRGNKPSGGNAPQGGAKESE